MGKSEMPQRPVERIMDRCEKFQKQYEENAIAKELSAAVNDQVLRNGKCDRASLEEFLKQFRSDNMQSVKPDGNNWVALQQIVQEWKVVLLDFLEQ